MNLVPAWKTSEFWLTLLMIALAAVVSLMPLADVALSIVAVLAGAIGLCVYTRSRAATRISLIASRSSHRTPPSAVSVDHKWALSNVVKPSLNLFLLGVLSIAMLGSLGACSPTSAYVAADQATYNAIAPEYLGYVNADANLTAAQKSRRANTVATWQLRINQSGVSTSPAGSTGSPQATQPATQP